MEDTSKISPLGAFLDDVALVSDIAADEGDSDLPQFVIKLMTIHASKGTEYDAVFLVNCARPDESLWGELKSFTESGGGVFVVAGSNRIQAAAWSVSR